MSGDHSATSGGLRQLGDYILLEEIGHGGMGRVYRARQISLDREVALKVLPSMAGMDPEAVVRFKREAEAAGRLSHPGIVPIYGVGEIDGVNYYAMELVEGPSLHQLLDSLRETPPDALRHTLMEETAMAAVYPGFHEMPIPSFLSASLYPASCAALIMDVAGALTVAHQGKVIHRDLKPSNILLHPAGRPVLVDFGLARDEMSFSMTQTGDAVGTPCYMAPEQAEGHRFIDSRVDVYGLGATLYEMLTLVPPFQGSHSAEIMQAILDEDPVPPRRLNPRVPRALETIVLKALAKDPDRRYSTTAEMQSDLRAFLAGGSIRARRPGMLEVLGRRFQRNRRTAYVAVLSVMFALLVGLMVGLVSLNNTRQGGRLALDNAKILLLEGRPRESHAAYVQAMVLLSDARLVSARRLDDFREVFPALYHKQRYAVLAEFLDSLPAEDIDRPEYHEFRRRLRGVGQLAVLHDPEREVEVFVRGVVGEEFEPRWRRLPRDGWLSVGRYLVRVAAQGAVPTVQAVEVVRDERLTLEPSFQTAAEMPKDTCVVSPGGRRPVFAVDRTEFSVGRYAVFLRSLTDRRLAAALTPKGWSPDLPPDLPVTGLSYRQVRTAAALLGGHLMSREEYQLAATAGLPELLYPWGRRFDVQRVVGDPRYSPGLAPAESKAEGASPSGILNLCGNAAELLSAEGDGRLLAAGGHHASEPADLSVHSVLEIADADAQPAFVGFRLAHFLPKPDDTEAAGRLQAHIGALEGGADPWAIHYWAVQVDGVVNLREVLVLPPGEGSAHVPAVDGFTVPGGLVARDPQGRPLGVSQKDGGYDLHLPEASGPRRLELERRLAAVSGLFGFGDSYTLRIPLGALGLAGADRLELPTGSQVDEAWPAPDEHFYREGAPVLVWRCAAAQQRLATVRFRRDGPLTRQWPSLRDEQRVVEELFTAITARDALRLRELLAEDCRLLPQDWDKDQVLRGLAQLDRFTNPDVLDAVAVGDTITVEVRIDWETAAALHVQAQARAWPMRVVLRRERESLTVLRLMPSFRRDLGLLGESGYNHQRLRIGVVAPQGTTLRRLDDGQAELQVEVRPAQDTYFAVLTGTLAGDDDDEHAVRMRLTGGSVAWRIGERVSGAPTTWIDSEGGGRIVGANEHWLFRSRDGQHWTREQWTFVNLGRRRLLLRFVGVGPGRNEARAQFRAQEKWFRALLEALRIY